MTGTVAVDPERLMAKAHALREAVVERRRPLPGEGALGSSRADAAFEQFDRYWDPAATALLYAVDALSATLRDSAREYELRDALSAGTFTRGGHAF